MTFDVIFRLFSFQLYEARLFRLKKGNSLITSADEAIDSQKKKKGLNLYFRVSKMTSDTPDQTNMGQRCAGINVVVRLFVDFFCHYLPYNFQFIGLFIIYAGFLFAFLS